MLKLITLAIVFATAPAFAAKLVTKETIELQKKATTITKLKNGIPVIFREIEGSDILNVLVTFDYGQKHVERGKKSYPGLLFSTMGMAANGYPKTKVFRITEKYALQLGCSSGIEMSTCSIGTLNDHWSQVNKLFEKVVTEPTLSETDLKLQASRSAASIKGTIQNSDRYVNDVVNRVFYGKDHPYKQLSEESLKELESYKRQEIMAMHKVALNAKRMTIVVVGSYDQKKMLKNLEEMFGKLKGEEYKETPVKDPKFDNSKSFAFESRDIPTAYIRAKFNGLPKDDKDSVAQSLMIKVLDEELGEEIRTKRSLSYAVWSYVIQYEIGIGMLSASTSKPKETLEAMSYVLRKIKKKPLSKEKLEEYKTVYATKYFLTLETHSSLASAIASTYFYKGSLDYLYEMPLMLESVTPKDVQRLAKKLLVNMRLGIVFNKEKFKDTWGRKFVKEAVAKSSAKKKKES
jgi:predicted Zn-dependent peptidase